MSSIAASTRGSSRPAPGSDVVHHNSAASTAFTANMVAWRRSLRPNASAACRRLPDPSPGVAGGPHPHNPGHRLRPVQPGQPLRPGVEVGELQRPSTTRRPSVDGRGPVVVRHPGPDDHHVAGLGDHVRVSGHADPAGSVDGVEQQPVVGPGRPPHVVAIVRREASGEHLVDRRSRLSLASHSRIFHVPDRLRHGLGGGTAKTCRHESPRGRTHRHRPAVRRDGRGAGAPAADPGGGGPDPRRLHHPDRDRPLARVRRRATGGRHPGPLSAHRAPAPAARLRGRRDRPGPDAGRAHPRCGHRADRAGAGRSVDVLLQAPDGPRPGPAPGQPLPAGPPGDLHRRLDRGRRLRRRQRRAGRRPRLPRHPRDVPGGGRSRGLVHQRHRATSPRASRSCRPR